MSALRERMERAMAKDEVEAPAEVPAAPPAITCLNCHGEALYDGLVHQRRTWYHTWECPTCGERRNAFVKQDAK